MRYKREYPLDLVITDQCIQKYNKIFFSLLKVKKILLLLKDCWKNLTSMEFKKLPRAHQSQVRQILILRSSMHNFMSTFEEYLMIDGIESGWQSLKAQMSKIQVFEELIKIHNEYLD